MKRIITSFIFFVLTFHSYSQSLDWALNFGDNSTGQEYGQHIETDFQGNVIVAGQFDDASNININPLGTPVMLSSNGGSDIVIAKYNSNGGLIWGFNIGGNNSGIGVNSKDIITGLVVDATGAIYVTGAFLGTVDMDPGAGATILTSLNYQSTFVAKYDNNGVLIWAFKIGENTGNCNGNNIVLNNNNEVIVTGKFSSINIDFDPGAGTALQSSNGSNTSKFNTYIAKYSNSGSYLWSKVFGGTQTSEGCKIDCFSNDDIVIAGYFQDAMDFDPGAGSFILTPTSTGTFGDLFLMKLNSQGDFQWAKSFGSSNSSISLQNRNIHDVKVDLNDNILFLGNYHTNTDFDPNAGISILTSTSNQDVFIGKYDNNGNYLNVEKFISGTSILYSNIEVDDFNNYYVQFINCANSTDFNPNGTSILSTIGQWVVQFTSNFNYITHFQLNAAGVFSGGSCDISYDDFGNLYATSGFNGTKDFDPSVLVHNLISNGSWDIYLSKIHLCTAPTISTQPINTSACHGTSTSFSITADDVLYYQWQISSDGINYSNISDGTTYSGTSTSVLTVNADNSLNGMYYRCVLTGNCPPDINSDGATLTVFSLPNVFAGNDANVCPNQSVTLSGSGAVSYIWTNGVTNNVPFIIAQTGTYSVTGTDANNCQNSDDIVLTVLEAPTQEICVVTVDTVLANHNIVVWEKPMVLSNIDSFYIYREITTNVYSKIGAVHRDSLSEFNDFGANPNSTSYKYKISVLDSCGNEGDYGLYHKSIHLQYSGLGNFLWTFYEIESLSNQVASYNFWRDDLGTGVWNILQTVSGSTSSFTDVNYASFPNARYRVDLNWISGVVCTPSRAGVNTSRSNIKNQTSTPTEINEILSESIGVFPNPTEGLLSIRNVYGLNIESILVMDASGKLCNVSATKNTIDISNLERGIYFIQLNTSLGSTTIKVTRM